MKSSNKKPCRYFQIFMLITGIFFIITGILIRLFLTDIYELIIRNALKFTPNSESFKAWKTNDPPVDLDLYLFNWTNAAEMREGISSASPIKPIFKEIGPYRVKEVKEKTNVTWNSNNTISYGFKKIYFYDPDYSPRKLDTDLINTVNVVPLTLAYQRKDDNYFAKKFLSMTMSGFTNYYVTKSAREIFFDGYHDGLLNVLSNVPGINVNEKFGLFYGKNNTISEDFFSMYLKTDGNFGSQLTVNYKNSTNYYDSPCNSIKGSAMEFYPLNPNKEKITFYSSELCRYAELEFKEEITVKGVLGYKYVGDNIFDNGTIYPKNRCFCGKHCQPSGVLDVSICRKDSPTFLSLPHFFGADPYYRNLIDGMEPDRKKHEFSVTLEPKSGIVMEITANMQINLLVQPIQGFFLYQDLPKIYAPLFYFAQRIELNDDLAASLRTIQNLPDYLYYGSITLILLGIVITIWFKWCLFFTYFKSKRKIQHAKNNVTDQNNCDDEKYVESIPLKEKNSFSN